MKPRDAAARLQTRIDHLGRLQDDESGFVVNDANTAFRQLFETGSKPASVLVRAGFVARSKPIRVEGDRDKTDRPKPPAADIIRSRGIALRLELALLFSRQCSTKPGGRLMPVDVEGEELGLINLFATGTRRRGATSYRRRRNDMRAMQVRKALVVLSGHHLVELGPSSEKRTPYDTLWLCNEAGPVPGKDPARYKPPAPNEATVSIPVPFFTNGWIQVMTDSEIWNWLAFRHRANMTAAESLATQGVQLTADTRLSVYDLTRDAWDTHLMLDRYGLMTTIHGEITSDLTAAGKQRFNKEPHRFDLDDGVLNQPGHASVLAAVAAVRDDLVDG